MSDDLLWRAGAWEQVTPETAGWRDLFFGVRSGSFESETGPGEIALVVLGGRCSVEAEGERWELGGRDSVFEGMPWALYLPRDTSYRVAGEAEVAICGALCDARREPMLVRPEEVEIEIRGAGNATRQINHILPPEFPAHRLLIVEVFTPAGSWSSFPPHKHDVLDEPGEVILEEVYAYRISRPEGFGVQRVYTRDGELDEAYAVHDCDAVLVPKGYHPFAAAHGYDCYYLNALAGDVRSMAASDDPDLA